MLYTEQIRPEITTDSEIVPVVVSEIRLPVGLETEIPVDLEMTILVVSEMETPVDLGMEIRVDSDLVILEDSVILHLNHNQDIMAVSDPVIPEGLETMADLIPVVVLDLADHLAVAALEVVHPAVAEVLDPVVSDNIQIHKKLF